MLLETLLWQCFRSRSQLEDDGLSAIVEAWNPGADSTLALDMDTPAFREAMSMQDEPLCDGLFVGLSRKEGEEPRIHCLFLELKGRDIPYAVEQLASALTIVREHLQRVLPPKTFGRTKFNAVVVSDRASPGDGVTPEAVRLFRDSFRSSLFVRAGQRHGPAVDLTSMLWLIRRPPAAPSPSVG